MIKIQGKVQVRRSRIAIANQRVRDAGWNDNEQESYMDGYLDAYSELFNKNYQKHKGMKP